MKPFDKRLCLERAGVSVCMQDKGHPLPHKRYNFRDELMIEWEDPEQDSSPSTLRFAKTPYVDKETGLPTV